MRKTGLLYILAGATINLLFVATANAQDRVRDVLQNLQKGRIEDAAGRPVVNGVVFAGTRAYGMPEVPKPPKELRDPANIPALVDVMKHGLVLPHSADATDARLEARTRCAAAMILGSYRNSAAYDALAEAFQNGTYLSPTNYPFKDTLDIRIYAAKGLGFLGDKRADTLLLAKLGSQNSTLRSAIIEALGWLESQQAAPILAEISANPDESCEIRCACVLALARIRDMRTLPTVIRTCEACDLSAGTYLCYMTGTIVDNSALARKAVKEHRLLRPQDSTILWKEWLRDGERTTSDKIAEINNRSTSDKSADPNNVSQLRVLLLMRTYEVGVAALPNLVGRVGQGETDLIKVISDIIGDLPASATKEDVLAWWRSNKDRWSIPWGDVDAKKKEERGHATFLQTNIPCGSIPTPGSAAARQDYLPLHGRSRYAPTDSAPAGP
jgi:hypothetical protein